MVHPESRPASASMEDGETIEEALRREMREETKIDIQIQSFSPKSLTTKVTADRSRFTTPSAALV